jgi:biotin synthase
MNTSSSLKASQSPSQNSIQGIIKTAILEQIEKLFGTPLLEVVFKAAEIHRQNFNSQEIQFCTLSSIKTGACPEDCHYCPQSARYNTGLNAHQLLDTKTVLEQAREAKQNGSTRFCMGASWRSLPKGKDFEQIVDLIQNVKSLDLEVCCTLGMLSADQAIKLKEAGLHTYNHNIDSSPEFYSEVISTRTFEDRIETINNVANAGIKVCSGGILGMGETLTDRQRFIAVLASMNPQPDSVPINALVPVEGTPLSSRPIIDPLEVVRVVATARIMLPKARVRLSAGRKFLSEEAQAMCFLAGANSIHTGDKLLTTPNAGISTDHQLMQKLGLKVLS